MKIDAKTLRKAKEITIDKTVIKFDKGVMVRDRENAIDSILSFVNHTLDNKKKVKKTGKYSHISIWVSRDIRALRKNGTEFFFVCEHEVYNRIVDTK